MAREIEPGDYLDMAGQPLDRAAQAASKQRAAAEIPAPALGYSILANLGDEKQITVQCFVDSEDDLAKIHAKVDRALEIVDRQKAKYRLKDLRKEVEEMQATLVRQQDDLVNLETAYEAKQDATNIRILAINGEIDEVAQAARDRGRAQPVGAEAGRVKALQSERDTLAEQKTKDEAERAQARQNMAVNIGRFNDAIAKKQAEIAECEALVNTGG